jgi:hypothetical protein
MICQYAISLTEKGAVTLAIVEKMTIERQNINCEMKNKKHLQKINSKRWEIDNITASSLMSPWAIEKAWVPTYNSTIPLIPGYPTEIWIASKENLQLKEVKLYRARYFRHRRFRKYYPSHLTRAFLRCS